MDSFAGKALAVQGKCLKRLSQSGRKSLGRPASEALWEFGPPCMPRLYEPSPTLRDLKKTYFKELSCWEDFHLTKVRFEARWLFPPSQFSTILNRASNLVHHKSAHYHNNVVHFYPICPCYIYKSVNLKKCIFIQICPLKSANFHLKTCPFS